MDRLDLMRTFLEIVDAGGFAAAARRLRRSRATVSRQMQHLEDILQVRLLHRTTRTLRMTEAGSAYYSFARDALDRILEFEEKIGDDQKQPAGQIRIVAPKSFGSEVLADIVADFAIHYPAICPTLVLEDFSFRSYDFIENGHDVALWLAQGPESRVVGKRLAGLEWVVCVSPMYLERRGKPETPDDLAGHACLTHINQDINDNIWNFRISGAEKPVPISGVFTSNSVLALRKAALKGLGIALLPVYAVGKDIEAGTLIHLLADHRVPTKDLMLYLPERNFTPRPVRVFVDYLSARFHREAAIPTLFSGKDT